MFPYDASEWHDLFVASVGAAAALAGLVFVAVSINLERILQEQALTRRALQTVLMFLFVVAVSMAPLVPGQSHIALGAELLALALGYVLALVLTSRHSLIVSGQPLSWLLGRVILLAIGSLPLLVGAISVLAESGGGLYWIAAGILGVISGAVTNAWVLLVEIQR